MSAKPMLVLAIVVASALGYLAHSARDIRHGDLARIDAKFHTITCDALRREVASRESAVESGVLFSRFFPAKPVRAYYIKTLPRRIAARNETKAEFARLGCPTKKETT